MQASTDATSILLSTLEHDLAITAAMACKRFGVDSSLLQTLEQTGKIYLTDHKLKVTHESRQPRDITFLCVDDRTASRPGTTLRHLAGVGEMRRKLGSPAWALTLLNNPSRHSIQNEIPDATWYARGHENGIAIEFDTGSQPLHTIKEKGLAYHSQIRTQIWAAPSARRATSVLNVLEQIEHDPLRRWVFVIDWHG